MSQHQGLLLFSQAQRLAKNRTFAHADKTKCFIILCRPLTGSQLGYDLCTTPLCSFCTFRFVHRAEALGKAEFVNDAVSHHFFGEAS